MRIDFAWHSSFVQSEAFDDASQVACCPSIQVQVLRSGYSIVIGELAFQHLALNLEHDGPADECALRFAEQV